MNREGDLHGSRLQRLVVSDKGSLKEGDGTCEHALYRLVRIGLSEPRPFDGHRFWARYVSVNYRRLDTALTMTLYPTVLGRSESTNFLPEIFDYIILLELSVDDYVDS